MQFQSDNRVEGLARRIATDFAAQGLGPHLIQHMGQGENLGNRFDGERVTGVSRLGMGAITKHDADTE
mgnify:CR=1 FL=1